MVLKNNNGQALLVGLMIFAMVFVTAIILIDPMKDIIVDARNADNLDCGNTSITTGQKATCLIVDLWLPYFIGVVLAAGASFVTWKLFSTSGGG